MDWGKEKKGGTCLLSLEPHLWRNYYYVIHSSNSSQLERKKKRSLGLSTRLPCFTNIASLAFRETPTRCWQRSPQSDGGSAAPYRPAQALPLPSGTSGSVHRTEWTPDPSPLELPSLQRGAGLLEAQGPRGSSGLGRARRRSGGAAPWGPGAAWRRQPGLAGCAEEAAPAALPRPGQDRLGAVSGLGACGRGTAGPCLSRSAPRGNYRGAQRCGRAPRGSTRWLEAFKLKAALGRGGGRGPPSKGRGRRAQRPHCLRPPRGGTLR